MIFTARQLEDMYKANGQIALPYRARLTPLAQDWVRQKGIKIGYADVQAPSKSEPSKPATTNSSAASSDSSAWVWWADSPCGPAKAALMSVAKEFNVGTAEIPLDTKHMVEAIKSIAQLLKTEKIAGGILFVGNGALAMVYANRCPAIRAVLGTCLEAVEQGVRLVGANVLVIEHPYKTFQQTKTLMARFVRGKRELHTDVQRDLTDLSSCA